jgi:hypothetical protein
MKEQAVRVFGAYAVGVGALVVLFAGPVIADPQTDYMLHCRGCHGPDGAGAPGAAPSFRGHVAKFLWVPGGREYLIRVPGTAQSELSDARTASLLNWILHEFSAREIPADFVPYGEEEIARQRRLPLTDVVAVRGSLMRAIQACAQAPAVTAADPARERRPTSP